MKQSSLWGIVEVECEASYLEDPSAVVPLAGVRVGAVGQLAVLPRWLDNGGFQQVETKKRDTQLGLWLYKCIYNGSIFGLGFKALSSIVVFFPRQSATKIFHVPDIC
jgi:hypothetical protein